MEKYIQSIGQNIAINNSEILNGFLLNAQQETIGGPSENESLDIFLMNESKITLNISTAEHSGQILKVAITDSEICYLLIFLFTYDYLIIYDFNICCKVIKIFSYVLIL